MTAGDEPAKGDPEHRELLLEHARAMTAIADLEDASNAFRDVLVAAVGRLTSNPQVALHLVAVSQPSTLGAGMAPLGRGGAQGRAPDEVVLQVVTALGGESLELRVSADALRCRIGRRPVSEPFGSRVELLRAIDGIVKTWWTA